MFGAGDEIRGAGASQLREIVSQGRSIEGEAEIHSGRPVQEGWEATAGVVFIYPK
jgi:hypothetical protein